jgi:hypothetical protein
VVAANSAQMTSADNAISNAVSIVSVAAAAASNAASNALSVANAASNAASIVSAAVVSVNNRISGVSAAHTSLATSVAGAISAIVANSAQMTSADNAISNAVSLVSVVAADARSIANAASNAASVVSNALSVEIANRISADNALSNFISANFGNQISILSQNISVLSVAANTVSNAVSIVSVAINVVSQAVSVLSQQVSVLSNQLSQMGAFQQFVVSGGTQGLSGTALTNISGLSISVAINGVYQVEAMVLFAMSTANTIGFGLTFPGMKQSGGHMIMGMSLVAAGTTPVGRTNFGVFNENGSGSILVSSASVPAGTMPLWLRAVFNVSTAGTIQLQARVSATTAPVNIFVGSFIKAFKIV